MSVHITLHFLCVVMAKDQKVQDKAISSLWPPWWTLWWYDLLIFVIELWQSRQVCYLICYINAFDMTHRLGLLQLHINFTGPKWWYVFQWTRVVLNLFFALVLFQLRMKKRFMSKFKERLRLNIAAQTLNWCWTSIIDKKWPKCVLTLQRKPCWNEVLLFI